MSKRAKTQPTYNKAKRPIDKKLTNIIANAVVAAQQETILYPAATFPGTITGMRWSLTISAGAGSTGQATVKWAIVIVPAGTTQITINMGTTNSLYDPEQFVMAFGSYTTPDGTAGGTPQQFEGQTKAMRKLKAGDRLSFLTLGVASEPVNIGGTVQFFYKT